MVNNKKADENYTVAGTDIEEVKRLNALSGLSYNEVKALLVKTGGRGTGIYSDTNLEEVKRRNQNHEG
ncbi:gamma-type small acid-soluble spore protein [Niallia oryzisoli]|uniref:gamma-type small acid-soluble spore protein n=1 Tax=Niallia oryzisoli TaxID=1737571 RepID=UPI003735636C